jgi:multiple antibiotic resistance protein
MFFTLLVIVDPVGTVPAFLALAGSRPAGDQRRIALKAVLVAGGLMAFFALAGAWLLGHLGISLGAFRVAGGLLLFRIAVDMVFAQHERETAAEEQEARTRADISVFPLAIPLIAGPGTLASVMILAGEAESRPFGLALLLATGTAVLILCYLALRLSRRVGQALGQTGVNVITRVFGILLAALAVQYVADGVRGLWRP